MVGGLILVMLAVISAVYLLRYEEQVWLLILWLAWGFGTIWIMARRFFSPPGLGLMAIMLLDIVIPATVAVVTGRTTIGGIDDTLGTLLALQVSVAAQFALSAGIIGVHRFYSSSAGLRRVGVDVSRARVNHVGAGIIGVTVAAFLALTVTSGVDLTKYFVVVGTSSYGAFNSSATSTISGYLGSLTGIVGACLLLLVVAMSSQTRRPRPVFLIMLSLVASAFLISGGQRERFVVPAIAAGLLWLKLHRGNRTLPFRTLTLASIVVLLVFGAVVGAVRVQGVDSTSSSGVSLFAEDQDLFAPLAGLVQTVPAQQDYLAGASYLEALYFPIPRTIWPSKPEGTMVELTSRFSDVNNGVSTPEYGEMYANFGFVGVIVGCLLFASILEWAWLRFAAATGTRYLMAAPIFIAIMLQVFTRDYLVSQLAGMLGLALGTLLAQRLLHLRSYPRDRTR
jgi:oligosaccharide repeat unit polymerase